MLNFSNCFRHNSIDVPVPTIINVFSFNSNFPLLDSIIFVSVRILFYVNVVVAKGNINEYP